MSKGVKKINKPKIELIDGPKEDEITNYNFTEKYIFLIEGY